MRNIIVFCFCFIAAAPAQAQYGGGTGEPNDPYQIWTAEQMNAIGLHSEDWNKHFILMQEIDYNSLAYSTVHLISHRYAPFKPYDVKLDIANEKIYWIDYEKGEIGRSNLNGTFYEVIIQGLLSPCGFDIDFLNNQIYWTNSGEGKIKRANLDGSNIQDVVIGLDLPFRIALDSSNGKMYWTDYNAKKIQQANFDGSEIEDIIATSSQPYAIILDALESKLYWTDGKAIKKSDLNGENVESLYNAKFTPTGLAIDHQERMLYWTEMYAEHYYTEIILRGNLDGGEKQVFLQTGSTLPENIVIDVNNRKLYWANRSGRQGWGKINCTDIDTKENINILPPPPFTGTFDGNHKTISNFTYFGPSSKYIGLFCYVSKPGQITNLTLISPHIQVSNGSHVGSLLGQSYIAELKNCHVMDGFVSAGNYVGGIVGRTEGSIIDCSVSGIVDGNENVGGVAGYITQGIFQSSFEGSVTAVSRAGGLVGYKYGQASDCNVEGMVSGRDCIGGLVGLNRSELENCFANVAVHGEVEIGGLIGINIGVVNKCAAFADVNGLDKIGCLVGKNQGDISGSYCSGHSEGNSNTGGMVGLNMNAVSGCYSMSAVVGDANIGGLAGTNLGEVSYSYSIGSVDGKTQTGGLIGAGQSTDTVASFWDTTTSGQVASAGGIGLTTSQMQTASLYEAEWVCSPVVWTINEGLDYPRFLWESQPGVVIGRNNYGGGTGTESDPYLIFTAEQLVYLSKRDCDWDKHFKLMADINLSGHDMFQVSTFSGSFNGNKHTISNYVWTSTGFNYAGLFGYMTGEIKDLRLENVNIDAGNGNNVGGLAGYNNGMIVRCYSAGTIKGYAYVGGLIGGNYGPVVYSCSEGTVEGNTGVGGLIGRANYVYECYSHSDVNGLTYVGGLAGYCHLEIRNCYASGSVLGQTYVGGLLGRSQYNDVQSSFWDIEASGVSNGVGYGLDTGVEGKTTVEMKDANTFVDSGWDFVGDELPSDIWTIPIEGGYPIFWWQLDPNEYPELPHFSGGTGEPNNPFQIASSDDLRMIGHNPRLMDRCFVIISDINMADSAYHMIGDLIYPFVGTFDGNNHIISDVNIQTGYFDGLGFFGFVGPNGIVTRVGLENMTVDAGTLLDVGGLVGWNEFGKINRCYISDAQVTGKELVGGLVGTNRNGIVELCYASTEVSGRNCGGLVGQNDGSVINSFALGTIIGAYSGGLVGENLGSITNCFAGCISSSGGFIGSNDAESTVQFCFWDVNKAGTLKAVSSGPTEGIIGKTRPEMMSADTFIGSGWDFNNIWDINEGISYPYLRTLGVPRPEPAWSRQPDNETIRTPLSMILMWEGGSGAHSHDVYFGTDNPPPFKQNQISKEFNTGALQPNTWYYWRVDEVGEGGVREGEIWSFKTIQWYGSGIEADPYIIENAGGLLAIGADSQMWDAKFLMTNNIDLSGVGHENVMTIGNEFKRFTGVFDGDGHIITDFNWVSSNQNYVGLFGQLGEGVIQNVVLHNVYVNAGNVPYVGAIVGMNVNGVISNCHIHGGKIIGGNSVGGIAGRNEGSVIGCTSNCIVDGIDTYEEYSPGTGGIVGYNKGNISNCVALGEVKSSEEVGGLVGVNYGTVTECHSSGPVNHYEAAFGGHGPCGGLIAVNSIYAIVTRSYSTAEVSGYCSSIGGLVGANSGQVEQCFSTGNVRQLNTDSYWVGGLVGSNGGSISNSYSTGEATGTTGVGGLVGSNGGYIFQCYAVGRVTGDYSYSGGLVGPGRVCHVYASYWNTNTAGITKSEGGRGRSVSQMRSAGTYIGWGDEPIWTIQEGLSYPHLIWENQSGQVITTPSYGGGQGDIGDPFLIYNTDHFLAIGDRPFNWNKHFKLMSDIDMSGLNSSNLNIIGYYYKGPFTGVFNGNGCAFTNFTYEISKGTYQSEPSNFIGIFGHVCDPNAQISNVTIIDPYIAVDLEDGSAGYGEVGALIGRLTMGSVKHCFVTGGRIHIDGNHVGGLIGYNKYGTVSNCHSSAHIVCKQAYSYEAAGGLVGSSGGGEITNCYATGRVDGDNTTGGLVGLVGGTGEGSARIANCYSSGMVGGGGYVGGLVGIASSNGEIYNCYSISIVSAGSGYVGGLVGRNDATVLKSYARGSVSAFGYYDLGGLVGTNLNSGKIIRCFAEGNVNGGGDKRSGGLVGYNYGTIMDSYAVGDTSGSFRGTGGLVGFCIGTIMNCYSTGMVSGTGSSIGGLIGEKERGLTMSSFWDIDTSNQLFGVGEGDRSGVIGKMTEELQEPNTFISAGWDFVSESDNGVRDIWRICREGSEYPHLKWEFPLGDFVCPDGVDMVDLAILCGTWLSKELSADLPSDKGDGIVNFFDWALFAADWQLTTQSCDLADFSEQWLKRGTNFYITDIALGPNGDGIVNELDFAVLAENWLESP